MITTEQFERLCQRNEGETLDFKRTAYDLSNEEKAAKFIKDVISMANTPRDEAACILLGVAKYPDGSFELIGLDTLDDEERLQSALDNRVHPVPYFSYEPIIHSDKRFGVIEIPPRRIGPCVPINDFPGGTNILRQRQVYFRLGSKNAIAGPEDLKRIVKWITSSDVPSVVQFEDATPAWNRFLAEVQNFERSRKYVLITSQLNENGVDRLAALGRIPWSAVFDFDPDSDSSGLLSVVKPVIEARRGLYLAVAGDRVNVNSDRAALWFFARGLTGRQDSLALGSWKQWLSRYGRELGQQFERLATDISPTPIMCVVLWFDASMEKFLHTTLENALGAFGDLAEFVIVTRNPADLQATAAAFDAQLIDIPLHQLAAGLEVLLPETPVNEDDDCILPTSSGAPVRIAPSVQRWLQEELELLHLNVGSLPAAELVPCRSFLQGSQIGWYELGLHCDVDRDKLGDLKKQIAQELGRRRTVRVNLYHAPGAGGTTLARRVLWDFHHTYPCAMLTRTVPVETAERLFRLTSLTNQPLLLLVDGAQIAERSIDDLYDQLRSRQIPVVILQTLRRFKDQTERPRPFYLPEELSKLEARRFVDVFSREVPEKKLSLNKLLGATDPRSRTAFYFGLESFGRDFRGIEPYVAVRLATLTEDQKKVLVFLSLAYHYAQKPLPAQAFAELLGVPPTRVIQMSSILPGGTMELLALTQSGEWRIAHDLLAREILEQLLWPLGPDRRNWYQKLSNWAREFARFCRGNGSVPSEYMLEIVRRTFVYRDNSDLLGTERSALRSFSQLLDDVRSREGRLDLLKEITELYPQEAHFWAHLGRYYAIEMRDYVQALNAIDHALVLQENDHVLHHMKGMVLRYQAYEQMNLRAALDDVLKLVKLAGASFEVARSHAPDDEHGYISEAQMLVRTLDYVSQVAKGSIFDYLSSPQIDPFLSGCLQHVEELLEHVRRNRESDGPSRYEQECRAGLDAVYGQHKKALMAFDNLLSREGVYKPPVRRQIVWTYLARSGRSWDRLPSREIERIVDLLEANLNEESSEKDSNLRLWVQAIRRSQRAISLESVIERVSYWRVNSGSLDASYYLYLFYALGALDGSPLAREEMLRYLDECRQKARFRRNRIKSYEWLGVGRGIGRLVHHSELGEWQTDHDFWSNTIKLARITGRISQIDAPQAGKIEVSGGLPAFFVPAKGGGISRDRINRSVDFYLGFSYEGLRCWEVRDIG